MPIDERPLVNTASAKPPSRERANGTLAVRGRTRYGRSTHDVCPPTAKNTATKPSAVSARPGLRAEAAHEHAERREPAHRVRARREQRRRVVADPHVEQQPERGREREA